MYLRKMTATAALLLAFAAPAFSQQPRSPGRPAESRWSDDDDHDRGPRGFNVELALRHKEDLKLSDAQVSQLEAVRKEIVADRQARATQMIDIQSRVASGLLKREDVRKQFGDKRDDLRKTMEARQDRIAKILTQEQQDKLRDGERREMQKRMRGRMGEGRMGHGMRGNFGPGRMQGRMMRPRMRGGMNPGMPGFRDGRPMRPMRPMRSGFPGGPGFDDDDDEQLDEEPVR